MSSDGKDENHNVCVSLSLNDFDRQANGKDVCKKKIIPFEEEDIIMLLIYDKKREGGGRRVKVLYVGNFPT